MASGLLKAMGVLGPPKRGMPSDRRHRRDGKRRRSLRFLVSPLRFLVSPLSLLVSPLSVGVCVCVSASENVNETWLPALPYVFS